MTASNGSAQPLGPQALGAQPAGSKATGAASDATAPAAADLTATDLTATDLTATDLTVDEYLDRYRRVPYPTLQAQLAQGDTDQVGQTGRAWYTASNSLYALADRLSAGLRTLRANWSGAGADGFERAMFALVARVLALADEAAAVQTGLSMMSASLRLAQEAAGDLPRPLWRWPIGVLDPTWGYTRDDPRSPQERLARVVADLALQYALIEQKVWYGSHPERSAEPPPEQPEPAVHGTRAASAGEARAATPMAGAVVVESPHASRIAAPTGMAASGAYGTPVLPMGMMGAAGGVAGDASRGTAIRWRDGATAWMNEEGVEVDSEPPPVVDRPD